LQALLDDVRPLPTADVLSSSRRPSPLQRGLDALSTRWPAAAQELHLTIRPISPPAPTHGFACENRPPAEYLSKSYYQVWLTGLQQLLVERGLVAPDELAAGRSLRPAKAVQRTLAARDTAGLLKRGRPTNREAPGPARFQVGDQVRAKNMHPVTHTGAVAFAVTAL
jgi:Nitrile hydratase beta subunit